MVSDRFDLAESGGYCYWLARDGDTVLLCGAPVDSSRRDVVGKLDRKKLREMVLWAGGEGAVSALLEGPMANEIRKASKELGISEQMIVWNAVKIFLEVGGSAE